MCANCGFPATQGHWTEAGAGSSADRLRARFRRAEMLRSILSAYGLTASDDGVTPGITISTKTGNQEIVMDLAGVWAIVERMTGAPIDPLNQRFTSVDRIEQGRARH